MSEACHILHQRLSELPRFCFDGVKKQTLNNGIYIVFEKAMTAHGADRIVHIGTHRSDGGLMRRLDNHLYDKDKDRSIFRKHIGIAILNRNGDPFLIDWEVKRGRNNPARQEEVEQEVNSYITKNLTFTTIPVVGEYERSEIKSTLLSTIIACNNCVPSQWLGCHHTNSTIRKSGLWNIQGLNKTPLSPEEAQALVVR